MATSSKSIPTSLLERISPSYIEVYVTSTGWETVTGMPGPVAVYQQPDGGELILPLDRQFADYDRRLSDVILAIAGVEKRSPLDVVVDLLNPSDILKFRWISVETESGVVGLGEGIDLFAGMRKTLVASALDELEPRTFHPRLQRTESDEFISKCKLGQTEIGSYVATVLCPLDMTFETAFSSPQLSILDFQKDHFVSKVSNGFPRRVTGRLMRSLSHISTRIDHGHQDSLIDIAPNDDRISGNFFEALSDMQPPGTDSRLIVSAHWSPVVSPDPSVPQAVTLGKHSFPVITELGALLRPVDEGVKGDFVGKVTTLSGEEGDDNLMQGEIILTCLHDDAIIHARMELKPDDYTTACDAHKLGRYVLAVGKLRRASGSRSYRIEEYSGFQMLEYETFGRQSVKKKYLKIVSADAKRRRR